jgi:mRNA deadenylase 3'-5' endonuclease subunit Ccr4
MHRLRENASTLFNLSSHDTQNTFDQDKAGSRDEMGEPLVTTTYHRKFMGTVDYIWHTDGLFVICVLDTLHVDVLERSHGLPSQKWGSSHL